MDYIKNFYNLKSLGVDRRNKYFVYWCTPILQENTRAESQLSHGCKFGALFSYFRSGLEIRRESGM